MKRTIILLKNVSYNYEVAKVIEDNTDLDYWLDDGQHVQMSEAIEVDFPEIEKEEMVKSQVAVIERQIEQVMAASEVKINELKNRKQELLAIGCDG